MPKGAIILRLSSSTSLISFQAFVCSVNLSSSFFESLNFPPLGKFPPEMKSAVVP